MKIDSGITNILNSMPDFSMQDIATARENMLAGTELMIANGILTSIPNRTEIDPRLDVYELACPSLIDDYQIKIRLYKPKESKSPAPGCVLFHGGAWVFGDLNSEHVRCMKLALDSSAVVVNVDYRLAPEYPFPIGIEDCYSALVWTANNSSELSIDPERIAVTGGSAGGNLAAGVSLMARDRDGPKISFQMLLYPVLDYQMQTQSMINGSELPIWDSEKTKHAWDFYLSHEDKGANISPYASPSHAQDLRNLPTTYIMVAEHDPLRDEGILYAMRLLANNISTELHVIPETVHGFDLMGCGEISEHALQLQANAFNRVLANPD
ncbi:alpha/beta hydrolase [Zhongshania aquimaris]|uniref:Alpha/beta hydrolase n=1 Tax=Zhongshania aquimaris TaxID=2857107 RepID=A0ABS6VV62_9GAMM|nr:alpha/beta hydrolase [Zhongshania aquimaris]MBW2942213.1 alpha/beta hydrolase [Zhongshania aquimaris]